MSREGWVRMEHTAARSGDAGDTAAIHEAIVAARLAMLEARFGAAFAGEGMAIARRAIAEAVDRERRIRQVPLGNADEPVGSFVPFRADDGGGEE